MKKVSLIAPAGKSSVENIELALAALPAHGFQVRPGQHLNQALRYLAADDEQRLSDLSHAWMDSDNDCVLCLRGGYGCARLLKLIDWDLLRSKQNILIGHSDISALHLAFLKQGLSRSFSGIMAAAEFIRQPDQELTLKSFFHCLEAEPFHHEWQGEILRPGQIEGPLIPVTLTVLCSLIGSSYLPDFSGAILVLEDIGEAPYKLDRLLRQLELAGILERIGGLIFADFNNCGDQAELFSIFAEYAEFVQGPVVCGLPFGHCQPRLNLPLGGRSHLEVGLDSAPGAKLSILDY